MYISIINFINYTLVLSKHPMKVKFFKYYIRYVRSYEKIKNKYMCSQSKNIIENKQEKEITVSKIKQEIFFFLVENLAKKQFKFFY